ncbi:hypothetical protein J3Q64DRAFT_1722638 [Phycomyces blakesleeanus]|uniref:Uncharacterized protein n=1 Tax=Phycomyces blakesleeanus TaxID=4837 RepID=A0ABR3BAQ9_PHYBL
MPVVSGLVFPLAVAVVVVVVVPSSGQVDYIEAHIQESFHIVAGRTVVDKFLRTAVPLAASVSLVAALVADQ